MCIRDRLILGGWASAPSASAAGPFTGRGTIVPVTGLVLEDSFLVSGPEHRVNRALAAALAVTLGPFGAHRLYLGTRPKVPLIYGLTFGGFGVLVLIDLGHILFTQDLAAFQDSERVFMWAVPRDDGPVTPP